MPRVRVVSVSSMVWLMSTSRHSSLMASRDSTEASPSPLLVSSSTVACTLVSTTPSSLSSKEERLEGIFIYRGMYFGLYDTLKPLLLGADAGVGISFLLGWAVTVTAGLMSYPIDTVP